MKKSEEYAKRIRVVIGDKELLGKELNEVINELREEIKELGEMRNISRAGGLKSIILEQDKKWKAICRKSGLVNMEDLFMEIIYKIVPDIEIIMGRKD